ncbi:MAG TPA: hypothetical protein VK369_03895 [Segetibacter sp.]|nr:hypothetical protein [Segetibacter sp.]
MKPLVLTNEDKEDIFLGKLMEETASEDLMGTATILSNFAVNGSYCRFGFILITYTIKVAG